MNWKNPVFTISTGSVLTSGEKAELKFDSVAVVTQLKSTVKARKANSLLWNDITDLFPVNDLDAVMTGGSSSSQLIYWDKTKLLMDENTLIIILKNIQQV